jgi:hypothetical protein
MGYIVLAPSSPHPYGTYTNVLVTSERSPLEPQTEQKY